MPPRDKSQEHGNGTTVPPTLVDDNNNDLSLTQKLVKESKKKAGSKDHNTPTNIGFRRNTFHWELNIWCFTILSLIYYYVIPETHRVFMHIGAALIVLDATRYYYKKGNMPGVPYTLPFVALVAMIIHPVRFWAELGTIAMESGEGICTLLLAGNFAIFVTETKLCREVMTGEGTYQIFAHPNALWLFGPKNLIYMKTEIHKSFRAILTPALFSKEALVQYAQAQERVCREYLNKYTTYCNETGKPIDARIAFRAMAAASSQEAFLGPYLTDAIREHLEEDIVTFTLGFLSFPFPYMNFGLHKAIQAKDRIEETIRNMVPAARKHVAEGSNNEPRCLLERWIVSMQDAAKERGCNIKDIPGSDDDDLARTVLDFLFAAQDATNSALAYTLDVLDEERDVLEKLRNEIDRECGTEYNIWTKMHDTSDTIEYIAKVSNQMLHHKPPVPMIPHKALKNTIYAGRNISKGTIIIPSITYSARTGGGSVDFIPERQDQDNLFVKTVTFGAGQHKCPGRRYAESLLTVFLAVLAQEFDFHRVNERPTVDEFVYFPTCFPKDCDFMIKSRDSSSSSE